jgi:type II secretory pathway component PulK
MTSIRRQRGITLVVSLVLLVVLTLLVMSMLATSNTNLRVVGNMQAQRQVEAIAQKVIEDRITSYNYFRDAINNRGDWAAGVTSISFVENAYRVTLLRPQCTYSTPEEGTSALNALVPEQTTWNVRAIVTDPLTDGRADVTQGVRMRLLANNCPP